MMVEHNILYDLMMLVDSIDVNLHGKLHCSCMVVRCNHLYQIDTDHQSIQMGRYNESH